MPRLIATWLGRWPVALGMCAVLAAAILLPGLGAPGLWEPTERQLADRVAPPLKPERTAPTRPAAAAEACPRQAPADAVARTLTTRAMTWGRDSLGDSDGGRKLPLALFGLLAVIAAAGTAMRLAGARAGILTAIALLAMPLCTLQSRMLTSEIGTACGGALIVYGLVALATLRRPIVVDALVATLALAAGCTLAFVGGGALLGLLPPIGAVAAAGAFGVPLVGAWRRREPWAGWLVALLAGLAVIGLIVLIGSQIYDLKTPFPGMTPPPARQVLGKAVLPTGCYAWALGGTWRPEDDLRIIYDSLFEQIAYGTFPWGLLAPIAMAALIAGPDTRRKWLGALTLAWAGGAWVAGEAFQRKVGFALYAGFPALAIAVGAWLDGVLRERTAGRSAGAAGPLIGLFAFLGIIDLGKDLQQFGDRLTSLLVGNDGVPYPAQSRLLFLPTKLWVLILGAIVAAGLALALALPRTGEDARARWYRVFATRAAIVAIAASIAMAAFWSAIWHPRLSQSLSSKALFDTYGELARSGDELVVMGDLGQAPYTYTQKAPTPATDRAQVVTALARPNRVFAIAPASELCTLHREMTGKPYFVLDDRNPRNLLVSNRVDGATDKNPLRALILHEPPRDIPAKPKGRVVWDGKIELLGWKLPRSAPRGRRFEVTVYYKILQPVAGGWKALMHFDNASGRSGNGDHDPIAARCPTSSWQQGDYIVDTFMAGPTSTVFPGGNYEVWTGFFTGSAPNWRNMPLSEAPGDLRDTNNRVKIASIVLE